MSQPLGPVAEMKQWAILCKEVAKKMATQVSKQIIKPVVLLVRRRRTPDAS